MNKIILPTNPHWDDDLNREGEHFDSATKHRQILYDVFMQAPAMLCILKGPDHIFEMANEPYRQIIGNRNPIGKTLKQALPELNGQGFIDILDKVYTTGETFNGKEMPVSVNAETRESRQYYLNFTYQPFYDTHNIIEGIIVYAYDVTEQVLSRNAIKESEKNYRQLIYGMPAALFTCDREGHIQLFNEAAVELWGYTPQIGKDLWSGLWKIYNTEGAELSLDQCPMAIALNEGRVINMEIVIEKPNGVKRNIIPYSQPIVDSEGIVTGSINTLIDITEQVLARKQMQQVAEMIEKLFMNAPAFICILKGPEFICELVNPEYQKLYGKRKLLGKKVIDALPELEGQGIMEKLTQVYNTGEPYVVTERLLYLAHDEGKEPEPTYLNFSYQAMYDPHKKVDGILVFGYEVTEQVLSKKKGEENLRKILESLPQITSASSANGTSIFFNKFFFEYSGLSREEATVNGWNSIVHPDEIDEVLSEWEICKQKGEEFYKEIRLKRKSDGVYRWHISHITPMKNKKGEITQWIASATDIHEQKTKEEKKDEFISIASHEMKTPLTTAKAYLQLLELSLDKANEKANLYTKKAILSVDRLKDLITELLDVSKIQHGKLDYNFHEFDFSEMIIDSIEGIQHNSPNHKIQLSGPTAIIVEGDRERLQQVVINLLSNAVKYSPDNGDIFIKVYLENEELKVSFSDEGIGIAADKLHKIFERYYRIEGQEILFQGLGIGLFISMEIIKRHNGKLWAESELGKGSTFSFTLPLKRGK